MNKVECENRDGNTCLVATSLTNQSVEVCEATCVACVKTQKPKSLNVVICAISFAKTKDKKFIKLWHECNNTYFNKPGTCLKAILQELGVSEGKDCRCDEYATKMDEWGTEGCTLRIPEIVAHLNSQSISWFDMAKIALGGYLTTRSIVEKAMQCSKEPS